LIFGRATPPITDRCICGTKIKVNCYIYPKGDANIDKVIIVGKECIKKWSEIELGRFCEVCGAKHKNRSFNLCKKTCGNQNESQQVVL
jgi:hypothetical protein